MNIYFLKFDCYIFPFLIVAWIPDRPWYSRDESAEIEFLRRHKSYLSEIDVTSSTDAWLQSWEFEDVENERDVMLFVARNTEQLGCSPTCDGCETIIFGINYKCLECKDIDLCRRCYQRGKVPVGHASFHKMVEMR